MENKFSILITKHNYSKNMIKLALGESIVSNLCLLIMMLKVLKLSIGERKMYRLCYAYYEDGKFGDQMYLDDWTERFEKVCVSAKLGCGLHLGIFVTTLVEKTTKNISVKKKKT